LKNFGRMPKNFSKYDYSRGDLFAGDATTHFTGILHAQDINAYFSFFKVTKKSIEIDRDKGKAEDITYTYQTSLLQVKHLRRSPR